MYAPTVPDPRAGKRTINIPYETWVRKRDPNWQKNKQREPAYQWSNGREFTVNPANHGPYADS